MSLYDSQSAYAKSLSGVHLFHFHMSNCSQRVRLALDLKGVDWTSHPIDLTVGEHLTSDYLAINPNGVVPTLVHNGQTVLESNDIIAYVDATFPGSRLGPAASEAAAVSRLIALSTSRQNALKTLSHHYLFRPFRKVTAVDVEAMRVGGASAELVSFMADYAEDGRAWADRVAQAAAEMKGALQVLEARLRDHAWLNGDQFGLADISWSVVGHSLQQCQWPPLQGETTAPVSAWLARVSAIPAFQRMVIQYR